MLESPYLDPLDGISSLDPPEAESQIHAGPSYSDVLPVLGPCETFRHSSWRAKRQAIWEAFARTDQPETRKERFAACGLDAWVESDAADPTRLRVCSSHCHDRFCEACGRERSQTIARNLAEICKNHQIRFVTFTLKHREQPLREQVAFLYACFRQLRRRKLWRSRVFGGVAFLEIKLSKRDGRWHPHLHVICQGRYLPQQPLAKLWLAITGDSHIVDIRLVRDQGQVTHYVCKYASKPLDSTICKDPEALDEAIVALKGVKLCLTFGLWRGQLLTEPDKDGTKWHYLGSLDSLVSRAAHGDAVAAAIISRIRLPETDRLLTAAAAKPPPPPRDGMPGPEDAIGNALLFPTW